MASEQAERLGQGDKVGLNSLGHFDTDVYSLGDRSGYVTSIPANEEEDVRWSCDVSCDESCDITQALKLNFMHK